MWIKKLRNKNVINSNTNNNSDIKNGWNWGNISYFNQINDYDVQIGIGNKDDQIRIYFTMYNELSHRGGDCEIFMTQESGKRLLQLIIEMGELSEKEIIVEDNIRIMRFESSDKNDEENPDGIGGNVLIIAHQRTVEFVIHFDGQDEELDYVLTMGSKYITELITLLQSST